MDSKNPHLLAQIRIPIAAGLIGSMLLAGLYFGIVSWAESPRHAIGLFWGDRWITLPIILGFGVQAGLYASLKKRLLLPEVPAGPSGRVMGASGTTSTIAMVAYCAHHVADVLPILGLTAATTFLAQYRIPFMLAGLRTTLIGIAVMLVILVRERRKAMQMLSDSPVVLETV